MAGYILIGSASIVQVLSPKVTQDTVVCTIKTVPTGIIATLPVSQVSFNSNGAAEQLTQFADNIEEIIAGGKAVGGSGTSSLDASGLTEYFVTFEVGYNPPGAPTGTVTVDVDVPVGLLIEQDALIGRTLFAEATALIDKAYKNLVALAGQPATAAAAPPPPSTPPGDNGQNG